MTASNGWILRRSGVIALSATSPTDGHEQVWQSPDGQSWHRVTLATLPMVPMPSGPGLFSDGAVIVDIGPDGSGRPGAWWTTDGETWTPLAASGAPTWGADAYPVTIGRGGIIAVNYPTSYAGWSTLRSGSAPGRGQNSRFPRPPRYRRHCRPSRWPRPPRGPLTGPPVSSTATDAGFTLKVTLNHDRYRAGQPIAVTTTLAYGGPNDHVTIWGMAIRGP